MKIQSLKRLTVEALKRKLSALAPAGFSLQLFNVF